MKLLLVAALAALATADKLQPDQQAPPAAAASAAAGVDYLDSKPEQSYEDPQTNHIPYAAQANNQPPQNPFYNPQNNLPQWTPPQNNFNWNQNYVPPGGWKPPVNNWNPPQGIPPANNWNQGIPPVNNWKPPQGIPPVNSWKPPQNPWQQSDYPSSTVAPVNDYYNYPAPAQPSTTQVAIIKNENLLGQDGSYKYEYETGDQTHVQEEGYSAYPGTERETLVKKGFYSYVGGDGKTYSVTYWADDSGFHAFGDHLPTPPPVPPAIQAYETGDQTHVQEEGYSAYPGTERETLVKKGFYSYVGGDGKTYSVTYWADDSGFHAFGDHLPTPPPVPPAIQAYETGDQTHVQEEGYSAYPGTERETLVKKGFYSYVGGDGKTYSVTYWADDSGFHAFGDHLPTPPPVPPAIQAYETGDQTHVQEEGYSAYPGTERETLVKKGFYSYVGGDGKTYSVTYWADDSGFHAFGDHLPTPPPVPPAIQAYETGDQTHVQEEGYSAYPGTERETLVKKGFYSYVGGDGKTYSVTYWADDSGFHAFGDHLPTPPPVPPAIQAALEQNAREEAAAAEAESQKNKLQGQYTPPQTQQPQYVQPQQPYVPPQNSYVPPQQSYVPPQQPYVPPQNSYVPPPQYVPPQQSYVPPQQPYVPPQNSYVPPQQSYVPPPQPYAPPQQTYRPS